MGNTQTKATDRWQKKVGLINKSFKLKKSLVEEFKKVCEVNGESQASVISRLMAEYVADSMPFE